MSKKTKSTLLILGGIAIVIVGLLVWAGVASSGPGKLDAFAQCIKDQGTVFYGAFWCPHCQNEKALFGKSAQFLPYVECSNPDGQTQTEVCTQKNIQGYPTWEFRDGTRLSGEVSLSNLADKTGCKLPAE